jgi:uncharacterized protein (TIGR02246 family)
MAGDLTANDRAALESIVQQLESAWNHGNGSAFGDPFADDADFVNVRGEHHRGKGAITAGHSAILSGVYAGSMNRCTIESARMLGPNVALVHVRSELNAPHGPLAGSHRAYFSMVLTKDAGVWKIAAFHNTLEPPQRPPG